MSVTLSTVNEEESTVNPPSGWEVVGSRVGKCGQFVQLGWEKGSLVRRRPERKCKHLDI